jgi:transcriptional regulator with XRE-family HTH domain
MSIEDILRRIDARLLATGKTDHGASLEAGLSSDYVRNMRRGKTHTVKLEPMQKLAPVLGTTAEWLMTETGFESPEEARPTIPVKGRVGAGEVVNYEGEDQVIGEIPWNNPKAIALEIVGESMGRMRKGWYAIVEEFYEPPFDHLIGRHVVAELEDGRRYIKILERSNRRGQKGYDLHSDFAPPIFNAKIVRAARVRTYTDGQY